MPFMFLIQKRMKRASLRYAADTDGEMCSLSSLVKITETQSFLSCFCLATAKGITVLLEEMFNMTGGFVTQ